MCPGLLRCIAKREKLVEKENVSIYSSQNKIITKHTQTDPDASFTRSQESMHPKPQSCPTVHACLSQGTRWESVISATMLSIMLHIPVLTSVRLGILVRFERYTCAPTRCPRSSRVSHSLSAFSVCSLRIPA